VNNWGITKLYTFPGGQLVGYADFHLRDSAIFVYGIPHFSRLAGAAIRYALSLYQLQSPLPRSAPQKPKTDPPDALADYLDPLTLSL